MGILKSASDIRYLREAAKVTAEVCAELLYATAPGVSTVELEKLANVALAKRRSSAPFKNFSGFGHAICVSINAEIVNGPPSRERILKEGDLVSIALAGEIRGLHGKMARTKHLGTPAEDIARLLEGTAKVLPRLSDASGGARLLGDILTVIPQTASEYGLTVIETLGGAGIGKKLHDFPAVPNQPGPDDETVPLEPGLAFVAMPMFSLGAANYVIHEDGWTFVTADGSPAAHFADTLLMTENGLENLTTLND